MDDLIKRSDALHVFCEWCGICPAEKKLPEQCDEILLGVLESLSAVDAVEVVRCRDCRYYDRGNCYNPNTYDDEKTCGNTWENWYCADGRRREDGDNDA